MSQLNPQIAAFGKIFVKEGKDIPALPDMKLIILKTDDGYQAVCVNLEIDSVGETIQAACDNLKEALTIYTKMAINNFGNTDDAVKDIVRIAYGAGGQQKGELLDLYIKAKCDHTMRRVEKKKKAISRADELKIVIYNII
jgi:predicted RNase H-like HicB family nuclease